MSCGLTRKILFVFTQFIWVQSFAFAMNDDCHKGFQFIAETTIRSVRNPDGTRVRIPGFSRVTVFHDEGETGFTRNILSLVSSMQMRKTIHLERQRLPKPSAFCDQWDGCESDLIPAGVGQILKV